MLKPSHSSDNAHQSFSAQLFMFWDLLTGTTKHLISGLENTCPASSEILLQLYPGTLILTCRLFYYSSIEVPTKLFSIQSRKTHPVLKSSSTTANTPQPPPSELPTAPVLTVLCGSANILQSWPAEPFLWHWYIRPGLPNHHNHALQDAQYSRPDPTFSSILWSCLVVPLLTCH